jgi:hypothetical protein
MRVRQLHRRARFPSRSEVTFPVVNGERTRIEKFIPDGAPTVVDYPPSGWANFDEETDSLSTEIVIRPLSRAPTSAVALCSEGRTTRLVRTRGQFRSVIGYYGTNNYYQADGSYDACENIFLDTSDTFGLEFDPDLSTLAPKRLSFYGAASPPPPPPRKDMCGCDCNTIATIMEDKVFGLDRGIKNHIDQRTIEELKAINKMLQGMKVNLDLQPVIDRLNQVEANLWNGVGG